MSFYKGKDKTIWKDWPTKANNLNKSNSTKLSRKARKNMKRKNKIIQNQAKHLIENGNVRVLVDYEVPPEAIAVLGKGLGFVTSSTPDPIELRLDARRVTNKIIQYANRKEKQTLNDEDKKTQKTPDEFNQETNFSLPDTLRQPNYFSQQIKNKDPSTNLVIKKITLNLKINRENYQN